MTPEHAALGMYVYVLIVAPLMALALIFTAKRPTQWFSVGFAAVLFVLWVPLMASAERVIATLA